MGQYGMGWEVAKNPLGHTRSSHDSHTMACATLHSRPQRQWKQSQVLTTQLAHSTGAIVPVMIFKGSAKSPLGKQTG